MQRRLLSSPLLIAVFLSLGLFALARPAVAQEGNEPPTDDEVNRIAKGLYCPVCENIPLDVCPTQACIQWRETIREKLAVGWTEAQIKQYFVEQYGDRVLATPPARGLNWLVYLLPPAAFLAGAAVLFRAFQNWRRPAHPSPPAEGEGAADDPFVRILEEELRRRS